VSSKSPSISKITALIWLVSTADFTSDNGMNISL
jgi:hypothetical protein